MQRLTYTAVLATAPLVVLSGLAMYKPVQLPRLTALLGGYDAARAIHLLVLAALALFTVVHVVQVLLHPRTLADMTRRQARSARRGGLVSGTTRGGRFLSERRVRRAGLVALGGLACDSSRPHAGFLGLMERANERFQRALFDPNRLAPELGEDEETPLGGLPHSTRSRGTFPVAPAGWALAVRGLVARPLTLSIADLERAPADAHARPPPLRRGLVRGRVLGRRPARGDRPARRRRTRGRGTSSSDPSTRATGRRGTSRARSTRRRSSRTGWTASRSAWSTARRCASTPP